jgi:hypothetical protein
VLGEGVDVREGCARLLEVGGEEQVVSGIADALLLGGLQLGRPDVLESLDDSPVGLCAF